MVAPGIQHRCRSRSRLVAGNWLAMNLLSLSIPLLLGTVSAGAQDFELILASGRIVDGTGNPWYRADIGIRNGRIADIGQL